MQELHYYTEQLLNVEEKEEVILKHLNYLVSNFDSLLRKQIKNNLEELIELLNRYST